MALSHDAAGLFYGSPRHATGLADFTHADGFALPSLAT